MEARTFGICYKVVVHAILIFVSEIWMVTPRIIRSIGGFHHRFDKIRPQYVRQEDTKIQSEDTIILLPEEKANSCQRDSECWCVMSACTCIVIDDGVTSMINDFDCGNDMLGIITFFENLHFLKIDD